MPIGKNAIKRVENNGYSNVQTSAPDMENSEILQENGTKTEQPVKQAKKKPSPQRKDGFARYSVGMELPYWLL